MFCVHAGSEKAFRNFFVLSIQCGYDASHYAVKNVHVLVMGLIYDARA